MTGALPACMPGPAEPASVRPCQSVLWPSASPCQKVLWPSASPKHGCVQSSLGGWAGDGGQRCPQPGQDQQPALGCGAVPAPHCSHGGRSGCPAGARPAAVGGPGDRCSTPACQQHVRSRGRQRFCGQASAASAQAAVQHGLVVSSCVPAGPAEGGHQRAGCSGGGNSRPSSGGWCSTCACCSSASA